MQTLFLTPQEEAVFARLGADIREGWNIAAENLVFEDSPMKLHLRLGLLRLHDPALLKLRERVKTLQDPKTIAEEISSIDHSLLLHDDLAALFFAMGSGVLTELIALLLPAAASDKDLADLAALTFIRHEILVSYHPVTV